MATLSLRQCAMADAMTHGLNAGKELQEKWRRRSYHKRTMVKHKTNVGDPNPSGNSAKARK